MFDKNPNVSEKKGQDFVLSSLNSLGGEKKRSSHLEVQLLASEGQGHGP